MSSPIGSSSSYQESSPALPVLGCTSVGKLLVTSLRDVQKYDFPDPSLGGASSVSLSERTLIVSVARLVLKKDTIVKIDKIEIKKDKIEVSFDEVGNCVLKEKEGVEVQMSVQDVVEFFRFLFTEGQVVIDDEIDIPPDLSYFNMLSERLEVKMQLTEILRFLGYDPNNEKKNLVATNGIPSQKVYWDTSEGNSKLCIRVRQQSTGKRFVYVVSPAKCRTVQTLWKELGKEEPITSVTLTIEKVIKHLKEMLGFDGRSSQVSDYQLDDSFWAPPGFPFQGPIAPTAPAASGTGRVPEAVPQPSASPPIVLPPPSPAPVPTAAPPPVPAAAPPASAAPIPVAPNSDSLLGLELMEVTTLGGKANRDVMSRIKTAMKMSEALRIVWESLGYSSGQIESLKCWKMSRPGLNPPEPMYWEWLAPHTERNLQIRSIDSSGSKDCYSILGGLDNRKANEEMRATFQVVRRSDGKTWDNQSPEQIRSLFQSLSLKIDSSSGSSAANGKK